MNKNTISSLGQKEAEIVARLSYEDKEIVTARELDNYLPTDFPYRRKLVYGLKKKRILIPIKSGVYIFVPLEAVPTGRRVSEFIIPSVFFPDKNYYLGYSTMFNYYNFTDQQFQTIFVLNRKISRKRTIAGMSFKFVKVSPEKMYGQDKINIKGQSVTVSSKERTLVDLIDFNQPVGGIDAASDILERFVREKKCDIKKLVEFAVRFPKIKVRKLIGVILEKAGVSDAILKPLEKSIKKTALISFTKNRKGITNEKWRAIVGLSPATRSSDGRDS